MAPLKDLLTAMRKHLVVVIIVGAGISLSTVLFFITKELEEQRTRKRFELIASQQIDAVKTMIIAHTEFVYSIRSFYDSADEVDRQEFRAFVTSAITRHPSIRAAAWVPRVSAPRRKAYEESAREDGQTGFQIREQNLHGALVGAEQRDEYYPLYYIEPSVEFKPIFGFDIASDPYLMAQLRLALDSPLVIATKTLQSMHFPRKDSGALIALPIFAKRTPAASPEKSQRNLRGFVLALYDLGHLISKALAHLPGHSNELLVTEITDSLEKLPLYHYTSVGRPVPNPNATKQFRGKAPPHLHTLVKIANRNWDLKIIAGPGSFARNGFRREWVNLAVGLLFTGLLALYFLKIKERTQKLTAARRLAEHRMVEAEQARREAQKAEETLAQQAEELVRSNDELQRFAYTVSHDLQEPLRMVSSYVQLLAKRYKGTLDSNADDFIGYAIDGANRMKRMINDLLTYSRVGTSAKLRSPIDIEASLKQAIANLKLAAEETQAVITNDPLPTLQADETQLIQLFQNLIGNAIKFRGQEPPQIHVTARFFEQLRDSRAMSQVVHGNELESSDIQHGLSDLTSISQFLNSAMYKPEFVISNSEARFGNPKSTICSSKSPEWLFSIQDNGIGIEPNNAEGLFTVFHRLHDKEKYPGTGIGLAVCKRIVERHGGRIWVESQLGQGTTFYFTIPSDQHEGGPL